jgi:oxygen-dependent protoporphyrinogen oxidase
MPAKRVAVVGAGISGLAFAHRIHELARECGENVQVVVFEASGRAGGIIETEKREGFLLEKGPDAFLTEKTAALDLSRRLGLDKELMGTSESGRKSFILRGRKLVPVPDGFYLIGPSRLGPFLTSPLFSLSGKLRVIAERWVPAKQNGEEETVGAFVRRRFGREALARAGQPLLAGIYTGDPENLSLESVMPRLAEMERRWGSVTRGLENGANKTKEASGPRYGLFATFRNGMQTLTDRLVDRLPQASVRVQTPVEWLSKINGVWRLRVDGHEEAFDAVCLALPAPAAAKLLDPLAPDTAAKLAAVKLESVATVNFAYRKDDIKRPLEGFGFVVPKTEKSSLVACSFSSRKFAGRAPSGCVLLRAFAGGAFGSSSLGKSDADLVFAAQNELERLLKIRSKPLFYRLSRYPGSMVQYRVGHSALMAAVQRDLESQTGLYLAGAAYRGVGIPDCIAEAEASAGRAYNRLFERS